MMRAGTLGAGGCEAEVGPLRSLLPWRRRPQPAGAAEQFGLRMRSASSIALRPSLRARALYAAALGDGRGHGSRRSQAAQRFRELPVAGAWGGGPAVC